MPLYRAELIRRKKPLIGPQIHDVSQVLYLPFDHDDGPYARDRSGYSNHGTIYGPIRVAGKIGGALSFDGVDDYVEAANISPPAFTLLAWAKFHVLPKEAPSTGTWPEIIGQTRDPYLGYLIGGRFYDNKIRFRLGDGSTWYEIRGPVIEVGTWYHVAGVFDGSTMELFVNGVSYGTLPAAISHTTDPLEIGAEHAWFNTFLDGVIDEVRIYNRALSLSEIKRLMDLRGV